jgi:hypothetical protein
MAAMDGRIVLRRRPAIAVAALLALTLVLFPSMGSRFVPTAALTSVAPATSVVHLLGDEVVAAPRAAVQELRTRLLVPDDLVGALLVTVAALAALGAVVHRARVAAVARSLVPLPASPGRSPPRRARDR